MELDTSEQVSPFNNCILCFVGINWCFEISAFQSILQKIFDLIDRCGQCILINISYIVSFCIYIQYEIYISQYEILVITSIPYKAYYNNPSLWQLNCILIINYALLLIA